MLSPGENLIVKLFAATRARDADAYALFVELLTYIRGLERKN